MLSGQLIDAIVFIYLGYAIFTGLKYGLFHVLVGIFGIYGASFFSWVFQDTFHALAVEFLGAPSQLNRSITFVFVWALFYFLITVLAKLLTSIFKLTGINIVLRLAGGVFNGLKAGVIITVILTFVLTMNKDIIELTSTTRFLTNIGSKVMNIYSKNADEHRVVPTKEPTVNLESIIIDDDFRYNLLER